MTYDPAASRRAFLKTGVAGLLALGGFTPAIAAGGDPVVHVVTSTDHAAAVRRAVALVGGMEAFIKPGHRVMLKPNMGWARKPEFAANTSPVVMAELTRLALAAGAASVGVTDNTCNDARRCFALSGIAEAVADAGGDVFYTTNAHYRKMDVKGRYLSTWPMHSSFVEADVLINAPIAKHHSSSRVTIGMKNWMGAIGGNRGYLHGDLTNAIADLAAFYTPALTVIDCTRVLMRGGPTGGDLDDVRILDTIVASTDPVAADAVAATFLDTSAAGVPHIMEAARRGLGTGDPARITVNRETA